MTKLKWAILCFALILTWDTTAQAYLDGNSGSLIIQALIGGLVGMGVLLKMYWHALLIKLGIKKPMEESEDDEPDDSEAKSE